MTASIGYNLRYFELHGRDLQDPWSCRLSALYHRYDFIRGLSDWVIIHPLAKHDTREKHEAAEHPMYLHLKYLNLATLNYRDYLNYIADSLKESFDTVSLSKKPQNFQVTFSSKQDILFLRKKLHHANAILSNTLETTLKISRHEHALAKAATDFIPMTLHCEFQREIHNVTIELKNYRQTVQKLLATSKDIRVMFDDILSLNSQQIQQYNSLQLTQIAENDSMEMKTMASLANKTYQDSRIIRITTVVAMFYLPASLVLSFFSTTLVWFEPSAQPKTSDRSYTLRIHQELWIAVVFLGLGGGTVRKSEPYTRGLSGKLRVKDIHVLKENLAEFPEGLDTLYKRMIDQVHGKKTPKLCSSLLRILVVVYQPPSLKELAGLIGATEKPTQHMRKLVIECGSFFTIKDDVVYFIHQSAKDFLSQITKEIWNEEMTGLHRIAFLQTLQAMNETLHYNMYEIENSGTLVDKVPIPYPDPLGPCRYSCVYWLYHFFDSCQNSSSECVELLSGLITFIKERFVYWLEALSLMGKIPQGVLMMEKLKNWATGFPPKHFMMVEGKLQDDQNTAR
ncbi:hypothetical protein FVEG_12518 [Fusarium verticillioides 7600]|uniref:CorA-like transporter domain-containing protein n=1 Tax=Gibberella moniliformis (strain M3125 / FGSC 7600) TaxID=334819 RepID=W7MRZ7_GIBM7|nr:hypothetical protein FVEG_12518 [Fusarium verticillioides 7600]EWG54258.1 hypothetical protein FVEG_12518 [Fusarium verticillioides 7600]